MRSAGSLQGICARHTGQMAGRQLWAGCPAPSRAAIALKLRGMGHDPSLAKLLPFYTPLGPSASAHPPVAACHGRTAAGRRAAHAAPRAHPTRCRMRHAPHLRWAGDRGSQWRVAPWSHLGVWADAPPSSSCVYLLHPDPDPPVPDAPDLEVCVVAPPSSSCVTSSIVTLFTTSGPVRNM